MEDAKDLRQRARRWRELAEHQKPGAANAMIEAACELELKAVQLERDRRRASQNPEPPKR
jgi:hypothetical protein